MNNVSFFIDGEEIDETIFGLVSCREFQVKQVSSLFHPDVAGAAKGVHVATATKKWTINQRDGWLLDQQVEWHEVRNLKDCYLTMLSVRRADAGGLVTDTYLRSPDFSFKDVSASGHSEFNNGTSKQVVLFAEDSSALFKVQVLSGWEKTGRQQNIANGTAYNKMYFDFTGAGYATTVGEVMRSVSQYKISLARDSTNPLPF